MDNTKDMTMREMLKDKQVIFCYFADDTFYYKTDDGFEFPVPLSEVKGATFLREDKAIFFMRWIREHRSRGGLKYVAVSSNKGD